MLYVERVVWTGEKRNVIGIIECVDMFLYNMGQCSVRVLVRPLLQTHAGVVLCWCKGTLQEKSIFLI